MRRSFWLVEDGNSGHALLDYELQDGPCTDVAVELTRRGVPFVVITGSKFWDLSEVMREAPRVEKPNSMEQLPALLTSVLTSKATGGVTDCHRRNTPAASSPSLRPL